MTQAPPTGPRHPLRAALALAALFLGARALCWSLGVRFDADNLGTWWQIADPALLRARLLPTLLYLHAQPPLFNLLVGLALKAGDASFPIVMEAAYGLVGLGGILCFHALAASLLGDRRLAFVLAAWLCVSPDVLLFGEKLFYDSLVPWMLCMGLWGIHRGLAGGRGGPLAFGFGMLAAVVLTRSMFHPAWFVVAVGLVFALAGFRRRVLASAALPAASVAAVLAKNLVLFGFAGMSSWAPLNLVGVTVERMPDEARAALVQAGTLSPLAAIDAFGPVERLLPLLPPTAPLPVHDPVLDALRKSNGQPNMNHWAMLAASRLRMPDALAALRAEPGTYAAVLLLSLYHFHRPPSEFRDVRRNLARIDPWARVANAAVGLQPAAWFGSSLDPARPQSFALQVSYGAVAVSLLAAAAGLAMLPRLLRAVRRREALPAEAAALALVLWTGLFATLVSTAFDVLENNRARYTVAPLLTLAAAAALARRLRSPEGIGADLLPRAAQIAP